MRALVQRVQRGQVEVEGQVVGSIGSGLVIFLGVAADDTEWDALWLANKVGNLRIFDDGNGRMNLSLLDTEGEALVISQFTLYGQCRKGRRPSFDGAAQPAVAEALYLRFAHHLEALGIPVATGQFQAFMSVSLVNSGPVTLLVESEEARPSPSGN
ncbi:MAG: D-tyrosyl-tRNA(Tyr) deacylase [Firmicutes bacterium]|nr:D-tyrosyl-tRNA(Tyr) deacylase [Bacillota bacterium]